MRALEKRLREEIGKVQVETNEEKNRIAHCVTVRFPTLSKSVNGCLM